MLSVTLQSCPDLVAVEFGPPSQAHTPPLQLPLTQAKSLGHTPTPYSHTKPE